jgi:hypothetical protein
MPLVDSLDMEMGYGTVDFTRSGTTATYIDKDDGLLKTTVADEARFESEGLLIEQTTTNECLRARALNNSTWVKTNITGNKNQTGIDGVANSCTIITSTAANGTCLQAITLSSEIYTFSADIKRSTGTGTIEITLDNGATWTDVTSSINSSTFTRVQATQTLANPTVGFRIVTSGDAIIVDFCQLENECKATSRIDTAASSQTRNSDNLILSADNIPEKQQPWGMTLTICTSGICIDSQRRVFTVGGETRRLLNAVRSGGSNQVQYRVGTAGAINGSVMVADTQEPLAMSQEVSQYTLYQRGSSVTDSISLDTTGEKTFLYLGRDSGTSNYLNGHITDLTIYNRSLSAGEGAAYAPTP